jgi:chromate transport protein ChrA
MLLRRLGLGLAAGLVAMVGAAFLVAAAYVWLASVLRPAAAAAVLGAALIVIAVLLLLVGLGGRRRNEPVKPEQLVFAALRLIVRSARATPERALITAFIAGVLSEWFGKPKKPGSERDWSETR